MVVKENPDRKKYWKARSINLGRAKYCILEGFGNCISSWCCKNGPDKSFFSDWTNNVKKKFDERITLLANILSSNNYADCLKTVYRSSPDVKAALRNIHKGFVVVPLDKATGNTAFICKRFYCSAFAK